MLILSQMPIPQTVLSILSYLSISIAIYWKLTNSLNTLHSSQFNRVHLVKKQITTISKYNFKKRNQWVFSPWAVEGTCKKTEKLVHPHSQKYPRFKAMSGCWNEFSILNNHFIMTKFIRWTSKGLREMSVELSNILRFIH